MQKLRRMLGTVALPCSSSLAVKATCTLFVWGVFVTVCMITLSTTGNWKSIDVDCWSDRAKTADSHALHVRTDLNTSRIIPGPQKLTVQLPTPSSILSDRLQYYSSQIQEGHLKDREKCTMIVQTDKKMAAVISILNHYCKMVTFYMILVLRKGGIEGKPPTLQSWRTRCTANLKFIAPKLTSKFIPRREIKTDCK